MPPYLRQEESQQGSYCSDLQNRAKRYDIEGLPRPERRHSLSPQNYNRGCFCILASYIFPRQMFLLVRNYNVNFETRTFLECRNQCKNRSNGANFRNARSDRQVEIHFGCEILDGIVSTSANKFVPGLCLYVVVCRVNKETLSATTAVESVSFVRAVLMSNRTPRGKTIDVVFSSPICWFNALLCLCARLPLGLHDFLSPESYPPTVYSFVCHKPNTSITENVHCYC